MTNRQQLNQSGVPIIGISRHRMGSDGAGVTTLVTFHGCNLRCKYCLNPEALGGDRNLPVYTPESLYEKAKVDDLYFRSTGGGITFGGGEPCLHPDFIVRFCELCKDDGWKIRVETSLHAPEHNIRVLAECVDEWIVDIKTDNPKTYYRYTDQFNGRVINNLHWLKDHFKGNTDKIILRIPIIPGYVDKNEAVETMIRFQQEGFTRIDLLTYTKERPKRKGSMIQGSTPGKAKCELLKSIRRDLASQYGMELNERECSHEGDCLGTCPLCEQELKNLTKRIQELNPDEIKVSDDVRELCKLDNNCSNAPVPTNDVDDVDVSDASSTDSLQGMPHILQGDSMPAIDDDEFTLMGSVHIPETRFKKVFFKECAVAGMSFHVEKDDELWDELCEGTKIALVRDRNNKHDRNAVAVALADDCNCPEDFDFDFIIGYIPRAENTEIAAMMDAGYEDKFEAEIKTYKRHGNLNERVRITIWLLGKDPEMILPDAVRLYTLRLGQCRRMVDELERRGTAHFRWLGGPLHPSEDSELPDVGDDVAAVCRWGGEAVMFQMKVIATGEDCAPFLDDPDIISFPDDRATFVVTNIVGPIVVDVDQLNFIDADDLNEYGNLCRLPEKESKQIRALIHNHLLSWLHSGNIDMDPSIDEP